MNNGSTEIPFRLLDAEFEDSVSLGTDSSASDWEGDPCSFRFFALPPMEGAAVPCTVRFFTPDFVGLPAREPLISAPWRKSETLGFEITAVVLLDAGASDGPEEPALRGLARR